MAEEFSFNPFDEETRRNPFPLFARARRAQPIYPHPGLPITSVFRYADTQAILRDSQTWSNQFPPPPGIETEHGCDNRTPAACTSTGRAC